MGIRNFGAGSRDMARAGKYFVQRHYQSYSSVSTVTKRFKRFVDFLKLKNVKKLEDVSIQIIECYAASLRTSGLSAATAQNYLSAVNVIMSEARGDNILRLTGRSAKLKKRSNIAKEYKGDTETSLFSQNTEILYELTRTLGLRFEEAAKLHIDKALNEVLVQGFLHVSLGTKGGQSRKVPASNEALYALKKASSVVKDQGSKSLIPIDQMYKSFQSAAYKEGKFHGGRHEYANNRYAELMGERGIQTLSPVLTDIHGTEKWLDHLVKISIFNLDEVTNIDRDVRLKVSEELGHHRIDVVSSYIGGR